MLFILKQHDDDAENDEDNPRHGDGSDGSGIICTGIQMQEDISQHYDYREQAGKKQPVVIFAIAGNFFRNRPHIVVQQIVHPQFPADPQVNTQVGQCPQRYQYPEQHREARI